jgi:hypothetical protein
MLDKSIVSQIDNLVVTAKSLKSVMEKSDKNPSDWLALGALVGQLKKQVTDAASLMQTASTIAGVKEFNDLYNLNFPAV